MENKKTIAELEQARGACRAADAALNVAWEAYYAAQDAQFTRDSAWEAWKAAIDAQDARDAAWEAWRAAEAKE